MVKRTTIPITWIRVYKRNVKKILGLDWVFSKCLVNGLS